MDGAIQPLDVQTCNLAGCVAGTRGIIASRRVAHGFMVLVTTTRPRPTCAMGALCLFVCLSVCL